MNKRGETNLQGLWIGMGVMGLIVGWVGLVMIGGGGDTTGYDPETFGQMDVMANLSVDIAIIQQETNDASVNRNAFDFFADIFNTITSPFKRVYNAYRTFRNMCFSAIGLMGLHQIIMDFITLVITVIVIIGIVMIKMYLGKDKNA